MLKRITLFVTTGLLSQFLFVAAVASASPDTQLQITSDHELHARCAGLAAQYGDKELAQKHRMKYALWALENKVLDKKEGNDTYSRNFGYSMGMVDTVVIYEKGSVEITALTIYQDAKCKKILDKVSGKN